MENLLVLLWKYSIHSLLLRSSGHAKRHLLCFNYVGIPRNPFFQEDTTVVDRIKLYISLEYIFLDDDVLPLLCFSDCCTFFFYRDYELSEQLNAMWVCVIMGVTTSLCSYALQDINVSMIWVKRSLCRLCLTYVWWSSLEVSWWNILWFYATTPLCQISTYVNVMFDVKDDASGSYVSLWQQIYLCSTENICIW